MPRPKPASRVLRSSSTPRSTDDQDVTSHPSPLCDDDFIRRLNQYEELVSSPESHESSDDLDSIQVEEELESVSTDETWTPSVDGEESDEDFELDDNASVWQEVPMKYSDFSISFNKVDSDFEYGYKEEVKELKKRVLREFNSISDQNVKRTTVLNANQVMNSIYSAELLFSVLGFQNKYLLERKKSTMDVKEYEAFLRVFFGLCFYCCGLSDALKHPSSYPLLIESLSKLKSRHSSIDSKIARMNDLLRSFGGQCAGTPMSSELNDTEDSVFWRPVFGIDRELEKLFRDVGGRTSDICFIEGYTNLIIDDEKLRMRSTKAAESSLSRHKSPKSFGPVGNCINSIATGLSLSCHMNHHGESAKDILTSGLMIISGTNNPNNLHFPTTTIHGDRGYNDDECFDLIESADMGFLNTTKRGPSLAFKFGSTRYNTSRDQRDISENGPVVSLGAVRCVGSAVCHFVAYRNGTGRVTFLQSTNPSLSYGRFDYVTTVKDYEYSRRFSEILQKETFNDDEYDPEDYLSIRDVTIREIFDKHCVYLACKGQGGDEWRYMRAFTITSTLCHAILPRSDDGLSEQELALLKDDLGLSIRSITDIDVDISWQHKERAELKKLSNDQLKQICRSYGRTFSNKKKDELVETVKEGPVVSHSITELEKILKYSFLQPLPQEDRSAHKLGSLNEDRVRSAIKAIVEKLGWKLVDLFECGLLRNKLKEFLATSLDGWLVIHYDSSDNEQLSDGSDSEDAGHFIERQNFNCGLEIKTPSSKKILQQQVRQSIDLYGTFSQCEFGSAAFKQLVYKPEYRVQVLHHATVVNLKYVLFVVAGTTKVHYAVLIRFPDSKLTIMKRLLSNIYNRSLKWAYQFSSVSDNIESVIPDFREDVISSKSYPITKDCVVFALIVWKKLLTMVQKTQLPLPKAHKIIPEIVARWNRSKGRVDEMTRYLDAMTFPLAKGTPKQMLVMREFKKMAVNVRFVLKHCFPSRLPPIGKGYSAIQSHHKHLKISMRDVLFELATTYKVLNPIRGIVPGSPFLNQVNENSIEDEIDKQLDIGNSEWQKKASTYVKDRIKPESRYKLKKFIDDEMLNRIRLDKTLFHIPKSHGSYVDARTGRLTSSGKKAKEKVYPIHGESAENDDSTDHVARKVRKCPPKCVVCCALSDPKDKESKISQTTIHCSLCLVALCIKKKGKRKSSCFEIFHQIDDLNWLRGKPESSIEAPGDIAASRKRTASGGQKD